MTACGYPTIRRHPPSIPELYRTLDTRCSMIRAARFLLRMSVPPWRNFADQIQENGLDVSVGLPDIWMVNASIGNPWSSSRMTLPKILGRNCKPGKFLPDHHQSTERLAARRVAHSVSPTRLSSCGELR